MRSTKRVVAVFAVVAFCQGVWADSTPVPIIKAQTFPEKELFQGEKPGNIMGRWIPGHNEILANINGTLELINPDNKSREVIMEGLPIPGPLKLNVLEPSPDGERVILEEDDSTLVLNLKTREKIQIADVAMEKKDLRDAVLKEYFSPCRMRWSPDGTKIAYEMSGHGIFVMNSDGTKRKKIMPGNNNMVSLLDWSKFGDKIALVENTPGTNKSIFTMAVPPTTKGTDMKLLVAFGDMMKWLPNSESLCFVRAGGLYFNQAGGNAVKLICKTNSETATMEQGAYDFDISPDGKKVAFLYNIFEEEKDVGGLYAVQIDREILVYDMDTGTILNITNTPKKWEWGPQWSPGGDRLMFMRGVIDFDPHAVPVLMEFPVSPKNK